MWPNVWAPHQSVLSDTSLWHKSQPPTIVAIWQVERIFLARLTCIICLRSCQIFSMILSTLWNCYISINGWFYQERLLDLAIKFYSTKGNLDISVDRMYILHLLYPPVSFVRDWHHLSATMRDSLLHSSVHIRIPVVFSGLWTAQCPYQRRITDLKL